MRIAAGWLSPSHKTRKEKDLLKLPGEQTDWLLLGPGGHVTIPFKGRACGIMTMLGPDAPAVRVRVDGGPPKRMILLDRWCYYWRDAVVLLCEGLSDATHVVDIEVDEGTPDHSVLKRLPTSPFWAMLSREASLAGRPPQQL